MTPWRRFGARSPNGLPAVSPRMRSHCARGTRWACNSIAAHGIRHYGLRRRDIASVQGLSSPQEAFRSPPGLLRGLRRNRHKETDKPEVNRRSPITAQSHENALKAIPTHGGIGTQHPASRLSFPDKGKETGVNRTQNTAIRTARPAQDEHGMSPQKRAHAAQAVLFGATRQTAGVIRAQNIPREPRDRHRTNTVPMPEPHRRAERPPRAQSPLPELQPAGCNIAPARNSRTGEANERPAASARTNALMRRTNLVPRANGSSTKISKQEEHPNEHFRKDHSDRLRLC